jgi:cytochrome c oxidase assembly protein subunit 15
MNKISIHRFYTIVFTTLITIYLVILAGTIVRSTGSGMGCPDWPKCFGTYIPPTEESQLPANYKEKYSVKGHPAEFNVYKTWTEYGNRLVGALAGVFVFIQCIYAIRFLKTKPSFFWLSALLVVLMGFQGVLGARVVFSFLQPVMITLHMFVALIIMGILIWLWIDVKYSINQLNDPAYKKERIDKKYKMFMYALLILSSIQIFLGTEVRQEIDTISSSLLYQYRNTWIELIGIDFIIHRTYSIIITVFSAMITYFLVKEKLRLPKASNHAIVISSIIAAEIVVGVILSYFSLPPWAQPIHLLLSTLLIGCQLAFVFRFMVGQNIRSV